MTTNIQEPVRVYVHWGMKVVAFVGVFLYAFQAYDYLSHGFWMSGIIQMLCMLLSAWVFFLADTTIDADQDAICITAPHGKYVMKWSEARSVEVKGQAVYFFGEEKAIGYNLLLAGKGKGEFQRYVTSMIRQWEIPDGRPAGVGYRRTQELMKKAKVRGLKLF